MPSRRRSRRSPQYLLSRRIVSAFPRKLIKRPQKLRLIRRYIKVDHGIGKPIRNPAKPFGYVTDKNSGSIKQPAEIDTVPDPIPDTGPGPVSLAAGSPLLGAIKDTSTFGLIILPTPPPSLTSSKALPLSFSALPPLPSSILSITSVILIDAQDFSPPATAMETTVPRPPVNPPTAASKTRSLNLAVIILLGVGSVLLLLGSCILIRICTRRRRKALPKPSLPIFKDANPEHCFFETKESPIFGGKERLSPMPPNGTGGPGWTWIQYPHAKLTQSAISAQRNSNGGLHPNSHPVQPEVSRLSTDPQSGPPVVPTTSLHSLRRQSMGAASIYSPRSFANIAQAITHDRLTTANGDEILTPSRTSRSQLIRDEKQGHRESAASIIGLAYDAEDVASPSILEYTPVIGFREGRERTRSSYLASSSYPVVSNTNGTAYSIATATRVNVGQRNSFSKNRFNLQNSNTRWKRANYLAQSPQPTIYPEDSMSVADLKRPKKRNATDRRQPESVPDIPVIIPDNNPRNSGLMDMDFRVSQMSLSELTTDDGGLPQVEALAKDHLISGANSSSNTGLGLTGSPHNGDMPPRVPSPPPLPSLSQMALVQHNPEAYANYRSPTYSLYGLYEGLDRRSVIR